MLEINGGGLEISAILATEILAMCAGHMPQWASSGWLEHAQMGLTCVSVMHGALGPCRGEERHAAHGGFILARQVHNTDKKPGAPQTNTNVGGTWIAASLE